MEEKEEKGEEKKEESSELEVIDGKTNYDFSGLLQGLQHIKITPLLEDLDKLATKKKYLSILISRLLGQMDVAFLTFMFSNGVTNAGLRSMVRDDGVLYFETTKYYTGMNKEARKDVMDKLHVLAKEGQYKEESSQHDYLIKLTKA